MCAPASRGTIGIRASDGGVGGGGGEHRYPAGQPVGGRVGQPGVRLLVIRRPVWVSAPWLVSAASKVAVISARGTTRGPERAAGVVTGSVSMDSQAAAAVESGLSAAGAW